MGLRAADGLFQSLRRQQSMDQHHAMGALSQKIQRNTLWNRMTTNRAAVAELLEHLSTHFEGESGLDVRYWHDLVESQFRLTQQHAREVIFIGEVGVGKSSALAVTTDLLLEGERPTDKSSLRKQSMLPTGAGRTTLCEVASRAHHEGENRDAFGLMLEAIPQEEMREIIHLWAEDEWNKRNPGSSNGADGETPSNSQEISRALRNMAGYAEYREAGSSRPMVHPLDAVVGKFESPDELKQHLLDRLNLAQRAQEQWWFPFETARAEIKMLLEQINSGTCTSALLPRRITLVIPKFIEELDELAPRLQLIDSRGLDAGVRLSSRADLQKFIEDPLAIYVLCAPFKSAPGDAIRELLRDVKGDARWTNAKQRMILVLLDQGDAEQVNGADGDRTVGLDIKREECISDLRQASIIQNDEPLTTVAMDMLLDDPGKLRSAIKKKVKELNAALDAELSELMTYARGFLGKIQDGARTGLLPGVNQKIKEVLAANLPDGAPMLEPVRGALDAIQMTQYPAIIFAACRRRGRYRNLDLYEAIASAAAGAATAWITPSIRKVVKKLDSLIGDDSYALVRDDLQLHKLRFNESKLSFVKAYSTAVKNEITPLLEKDKQLWADCIANWGLSNGFKSRVHEHLRQWSDRQVFKEHLELGSKTSEIPFWSVLLAAQSAPRFSLHIKNLRALSHAVFSPESVSLLVGANGAGKSTLLHSLKLLRLAYERGLTEAIRLVLSGTYGIKNWSATPEEYIEVGLKIGETAWLLQLAFQNSGLELQYQEKLIYQGETVFIRDASNNVQYGGNTVYASGEYTALKVLVDRGEIHPAIQQMSDLLGRVSVFEEPDLFNLRHQGSPAFEDAQLQGRGQNVLSILRRWQQDSQLRNRFDFVVQGLQAAFPAVKQMDFVSAGNMLAARIYHEGVEEPTPLANEANGLLQMLVLLANVAQSNPGGVVAIDEPENGLHPYAVRMFLRSCQQWALKYRVTFVLATHSLVLLDEFTNTPEAVFVMKALEDADPVPNPLDHLCNRDWLQGFKLGDLYEQGEIGSNDDGF